MSIEAITARLEQGGIKVRGRAFRCPFHDDKSASGSIFDADGKGRWKCHSCGEHGDLADLEAKLSGRPLGEVLKEQNPHRFQRQERPQRQEPPVKVWPDLETLTESIGAVKVYRYLDADRKPLMAVLRLEPKSFRQASPCAGGWHMRKPSGRLPLFNLPSFAKADLIVVCEGERDCIELHALGITATTAPMGADAASVPLEDDGKPSLADWQPCAGKTVILWGDFDEPGRRHIARIERILSRICPRPTIKRVQEIDIDDTKDAADFITKHGDKALRMVLGVLNRAIEIRPSDALRQRMRDIASGKLRSELWPFPGLSRLSESLRPGSIVLIAGDPGNGKSLLVLQSLLAWIGDGVKASYLALEEDAAFYLRRTLAILAGKSEVLSDDWVRFNGAQAEELRTMHTETLDAVAQSLTTAPPNAMTTEKIGVWVETQAKSGIRIMVVDPITATAEDGTVKPWTAAQNLMAKIKQVAVAHGISVVLVTHCKKNPGKNAPPDLDSLAGGAAYARFSSAVFLLSKLEQPEEATVLDADGREIIQECTHRLKIAKSRDGRGSGISIAFDFEGKTLRFTELGALINRPGIRQRKTNERQK